MLRPRDAAVEARGDVVDDPHQTPAKAFRPRSFSGSISLPCAPGLEVEVRAGAGAGAARAADDLPGRDHVPALHEGAREVRVHRHDPALVAHLDDEAVARVVVEPADVGDAAGPGRAHARLAPALDVDPVVHSGPSDSRTASRAGRPWGRANAPPGGSRRAILHSRPARAMRGRSNKKGPRAGPYCETRGGTVAEAQKISGHQGLRSVRKRASARAIAPSFTSSTRPARRRSENVNPPR